MSLGVDESILRQFTPSFLSDKEGVNIIYEELETDIRVNCKRIDKDMPKGWYCPCFE